MHPGDLMPKEEPKKPTLSEILPKLKIFFIAVMIFPIIGMFMAIAIIWIQHPKNFEIIISAIGFLMVFYLVIIYYTSKKMDALTKASKEPSN
jgi:hypothetical protein